MSKVRENEDRLVIGFSENSKDEICLVIAREEKNGYRVIKELFGTEAKNIYDSLTESKTISSDEENKIYNWIYRSDFFDPDREILFKRVEEALGFKLFIWQKTFIETGIFRRYGETTAKCLRDLLAVDSPPLDFSKKPTHFRSEFYKQEMKKIQQKLNEAGIQTRKVFWSESDKRKYTQ